MMLTVVALFALGSGISGGTNNAATLIGGRAVQGIGGGGINLLIELIVSNLVSLRERGAYSGIVLGAFSLGTAVGPLVGGVIVDGTTWRWIFWINVLVAGVALALQFLFLRVDYYKETAILTKLKRVDYAGNIILVAIVVAVLLALSWGGTKCPWSLYRVLVPLIVGVFGPIIFHIYEDLPDSDTTAATAAFVFMRAYGSTWGVSIPAAIFNAQFAKLSRRIGDADIQVQLSGGNAYSFANVD
ncbi:hypothetical protein NPX13_g3415 [Xylaria arbuscula]|uniref:Major facilitator superfamily (MFS) profile domain-containing protein n=1 Tax=Xylaria arbuscula TaxID=114810 RepID=A0A9W8NII1_9PEZI|nr:hypothetical protein NPX13_g3415 [Xylaria arbuscula]